MRGKEADQSFALTVHQLRTTKNMSLKEIGEVTQRSESQVSRILTGTSPLTGERWIRKMKGRKRVDRLDNKELLNVMVASKEIPDELTEKHKADRARWC